jgi:LysM domain-containing protein
MRKVDPAMRSAKLKSSAAGARRLPAFGLGLAVALSAAVGFAQSDDEAGGGAPETAAPAAQGQPVQVAPATTTTSTSYQPSFLPAPGTNLDAHLPSSAQSKTDIYQPDTFDLRPPAGGAVTLHGNTDALGVLSGDGVVSSNPGRAFHIVRKGDTLWGICGEQLDDPRLWPRMWSYNPQLQNPHWIYPGDQLRLRPPAANAADLGVGGLHGGTLGRGLVTRTALVPPDTVFLRELGYIDDPDKDVWGEIVGARQQQQLLADGNQVYMILRPGVEVQLGQLMTIFQDVRDPPDIDGARRPPGQIVAFKGTVKIDSWDAQSRVARGELVESLDVVERGFKVGPIGRRYIVVPPAPSQVDVAAVVLTGMYPHLVMGRDQIVFIDRGANDGLKAGNRLFVVRQGDPWRHTLVTSSVMARSRILMEVPERVVIEPTPLDGDEETFPQEVVAELRVIRAHRYSSLALVTESHQEIEPGDHAVARKGF